MVMSEVFIVWIKINEGKSNFAVHHICDVGHYWILSWFIVSRIMIAWSFKMHRLLIILMIKVGFISFFNFSDLYLIWRIIIHIKKYEVSKCYSWKIKIISFNHTSKIYYDSYRPKINFEYLIFNIYLNKVENIFQ